ncbi:MAG: hypothetical protein SWJ54_21825 [Cyanobacteriota bacterium]|nr:hypothetical protein [Cyanobacteriota bacterium]
MADGKPQLHIDNYSPSLLVAKLHSYFRDFLDYYEIERGRILSSMEMIEDDSQQEELREKLKKLGEQAAYMGALSDSLSAANRLIHAEGMIVNLGLEDDIYKVSHLTEP